MDDLYKSHYETEENHTAEQMQEYSETYPWMFLRMLEHGLNHLYYSSKYEYKGKLLLMNKSL